MEALGGEEIEAERMGMGTAMEVPRWIDTVELLGCRHIYGTTAMLGMMGRGRLALLTRKQAPTFCVERIKAVKMNVTKTSKRMLSTPLLAIIIYRVLHW